MNGIVFDAMSYAYPRGAVVLQDISLTIPKGAFAVITGPEGAGKTTLCLAMTGAVPAYFGGRMAGCVTVGGIDTARASVVELARKVGLVMADYDSQLVALTVADEVAFGLENRGVSQDDIGPLSAQALEMVGLKGKEHREVASLSGGQRQRLAIAGILVTRPDILILDEPTSALDPEGAADLYGWLGELNRRHGKTVVVVEHNLAAVLPYADTLIVMMDGQIAACGRPDDVLNVMETQNIYAEAVPQGAVKTYGEVTQSA